MTPTYPAADPAAAPGTPPALVIAADGARLDAVTEAWAVLVDQVRLLLPAVRVEVGIVDPARPTMAAALDSALADVDAAVVVPLIVGSEPHNGAAIPEAIDAYRAEHPEAQLRIANAIGPCDELAAVVAQRYRQGAQGFQRSTGSPAYLTGLLLHGRKVVVVGGGNVARRRVPKLLDAGAVVEVIAPELHHSLRALADANAFTWRARAFRPDDLDGAWYVQALTDSAETNAAIVAGAEARHTFCVRADRAYEGSAWTPATGAAAGVTVAAITSHDPLRARRIRNRFVELVNEEGL